MIDLKYLKFTDDELLYENIELLGAKKATQKT